MIRENRLLEMPLQISDAKLMLIVYSLVRCGKGPSDERAERAFEVEEFLEDDRCEYD